MSYRVRIERVCAYIQHNPDADLSLEALSAVACLSKFHFHRVFLATTGVHLFRYIQLTRLKQASMQLVYRPEMPVIRIALEAGFESPEAFARAFKKTFGQTPSGFRKQPEWPLWHSRFDFSVTKGTREMEVKIVNFVEAKVAVLAHRGDPKLVPQSVGKFIEWRKATGLSPVQSSRSFGIGYDDPAVVAPEAFRFDLCGTVVADVPRNTFGITTGRIPAGRCAVVRHKGSLDNLADTVYYLYREWLQESGEEIRDYPCFFEYLNLIPDVAEHELLTDVYLPIQ